MEYSIRVQLPTGGILAVNHQDKMVIQKLVAAFILKKQCHMVDVKTLDNETVINMRRESK